MFFPALLKCDCAGRRLQVSCPLKRNVWGWHTMAQRELAAPEENLGSVTSTFMVAHNSL